MNDGETRARRLIVAAAVWLAVAEAAAQPSPAPMLLALDRTITTAHEAGQRIEYTLDAQAGENFLIVVEQIGLDFALTVDTPDGVSRTYDSPLLRDEREVVLLENTVQGVYVITVRSEEHTAAAGAHSILATRPADGELEGWRELTLGAALNFASGDEAWRAAAAAYASAATAWRAAGRNRELAQALFAAAAVQYWQLYDWPGSAELAAEAATLYDGLAETRLSANATHLRAAALIESALEVTGSSESAGGPTAGVLFDEALELLERARRTHEQLGHLYDLGLVLNNFGYLHYNRGEHDSARTYWQQAAGVMRSVDELTGELNPISNLAVLDAERGNLAVAIDSFERILEILPPGQHERYRADTLDNLGISYIGFGDMERALAVLTAALAIQEEIDDLQGRGRSLRSIGRAYYALGNLELAHTYLDDALAIARDTNDGRSQEAIFRDLGNIAYLRQDYAAALELHRRALDIVQSATDEAYLELLVAKDLIALGRGEEAAELAAETLAETERIGTEPLIAEALHRLGSAGTPDRGAAFAPLERAAAIYERLGLAGQRAEVLHTLAFAARAEGRFARAAAYGDAALDHLERMRLRVASPELRAFFSAARRDYYESQIVLLMALHAENPAGGHARAALATSERARARMIGDLLQEASIDLRVDGSAELEQRQENLYQRLAERAHERDRLTEAPGDGGATRLSAVLAEIASIENALNLLDIELRNASPGLASLSPLHPLDVSGMQTLLDPDTVLLQYAFAEQNAYVWVVSSEHAAVVELAERSTIDTAARQVLDHLTAYSPDRAARRAFDEALDTLADLLIAPVADQLGASRIILSLDDVLQYVPFSALPIQAVDGGRERLIERFSLVRTPSMSALGALRDRHASAEATKTLAVFADPVLNADDPRLPGRVPPLSEAMAGTLAAPRTDAGIGTSLQRLPSTAQEAEAIAGLVPDDRRLLARGFDASRDTVLGADLGEYRYLHFATHGLVNARYPALSALALSHFDASGTPRNGLLRLGDIYRLRLNADLVVLSACETALGREVRGEGLLGLSQGFLYAGARSLVASLWQVPDRATSELMAKVYAFMLDDGLPPGDALRRAQLEIAAERRWSDPYFWGGFVVLGDWR